MVRSLGREGWDEILGEPVVRKTSSLGQRTGNSRIHGGTEREEPTKETETGRSWRTLRGQAGAGERIRRRSEGLRHKHTSGSCWEAELAVVGGQGGCGSQTEEAKEGVTETMEMESAHFSSEMCQEQVRGWGGH